MDAQLTSGSAVLDELWDEFVADVRSQQAAQQERKAARLAKAQATMWKTPAEVLAALGLDVATAVWPENGGQALVEGVCVWQGLTLATAITADEYGRSELRVAGETVNPQAPDVRARVGQALGQAVRSQQLDRERRVARLREKAATWRLDSEDLANGKLTLAALPFVQADELAEVRQTVARRKWADKQKRHAERRVRAERAWAQAERARGLWVTWQAWQRANDEFKAAALAWASKWAALIDERYGEAELWEVTFGARGEGRVQADEDAPGLWLTAVVLEAPGDLAVGAHGLTRVTAVTWAGQTEERWIGPVAQVRRVQVLPRTVTAALAYHRNVWCGGYVVNVPPVAPAEVRPERDMPASPVSLDDWLDAEGYEREAGAWEFGGDTELTEEVALEVVVRRWK